MRAGFTPLPPRRHLLSTCTPWVKGLGWACSGCRKPTSDDKTEHLPFRFRSKKPSGNTVPPRLWSFLPTGIVPTLRSNLAWRLSPEPLMYEFVSGTKLTPGTGSLRSRRSLAGLRQLVQGPYKDMRARGYSVADRSRRSADQALFLAAKRGRFCLTLYRIGIRFRVFICVCEKLY